MGELVEERAGRIPEPGALHPTRERLPHGIRQAADEHVGPHPVLLLVPHRPDGQFVFRDPEGPLCLGELDVSLPERGRIDACEIRSQEVAAIDQLRPLVELFIADPAHLQMLFPDRLRP